MPTNKQLTDFVVNMVESQEVYDYMKANNLINDEEIYLVGGESAIKAEYDGDGNVITDTYATKNELENYVASQIGSFLTGSS